tara:strand:- start:14257 stop:14964 length:708 start_codon:yes stop_codon:yes gene_type:complete
MQLAVNIDHVATIRQARRGLEPEPITAALLAELAGAAGITVHLRGDRRHIQERDVELLKTLVKTKLNIEMAATPEMVAIATRISPYQVTLVPEQDYEITTTGGLDLVSCGLTIKRTINQLKSADIQVGIFIDPKIAQIRKARAIGAQLIELNTGPYSEGKIESQKRQLGQISRAAGEGVLQGLKVAAGHGLTYDNVGPIVKIRKIEELNIGHSIISRAVLVGIERAVREMLDLMK